MGYGDRFGGGASRPNILILVKGETLGVGGATKGSNNGLLVSPLAGSRGKRVAPLGGSGIDFI